MPFCAGAHGPRLPFGMRPVRGPWGSGRAAEGDKDSSKEQTNWGLSRVHTTLAQPVDASEE
jgi:hypothetical protein